MTNHTLAEQLDLAARGDLDLAVFVMDEDAPFMVKAIRDRGLQIAGFSHLDVVSRRLPRFKTGRIGAGQYDPVRVVPAEDKRVLRVETLVITILVFRLVRNNPAGLVQRVRQSPALMFCAVFVMTFGVAVGLSTLNLGTLSRYRIPMMPFFFVLLLVLHRAASVESATIAPAPSPKRNPLGRPVRPRPLSPRRPAA
jgi:hypothetical protein